MVQHIARGMDAMVARFDTWQRGRRRLAFLLAVVRKYTDDEAGSRAALLAYYAFLSIFPLLLVLTTLLNILLQRGSPLSSEIIRNVVDYFPAVGHSLEQNVHALDRTGVALVIGIALTLFGARGVADVLRNSLDHIWQVPYARRSRLPDSLWRSFGIIVIGGLGLALTPLVLGYVLAFFPNRLVGGLSAILTMFVQFWVLMVIIKIGTSVKQPLRRIWLGAMLAVISLGLLQSIGGIIMAHELQRLDSLYGTFALVIGLTFWLYLQAQLLLFALEWDSVRVLKLFPRSFHPPLTDADQAAFRLYHDRARFHDDSL